MSVIDVLRHEQQQCNKKISDIQGKIRKVENDYDSLLLFKRQVQKSQDEVEALNTAKKGILKDVARVKTNSKVAQGYYNGMKDMLSGIGTKMIPLAFIALLASIDLQLRSYQQKVADYEDDIDKYERKINDLDKKITIAEAVGDAIDVLDI